MYMPRFSKSQNPKGEHPCVFSGHLIERFGRSVATSVDPSNPGMILQLV